MRIRRSMLFIPGNNPAMMLNAPILGADTIIFDIEDAVQYQDKDAARVLIRNALKTFPRDRIEFAVRINDVTTPYWREDLETIVEGRPDAVVVPKAEHADKMEMLDQFVLDLERKHGLPERGIKFLPLLETALGIQNAYQVAGTCKGRSDGLMMGNEDLMTDLCGVRTEDGWEVFFARQQVVIAARAAGLPPIDSAYADVENIEGLKKDTHFSRTLGYAGRAIVSPRHVRIVNDEWTPSDAEIKYAHEVMDVLEDAKKSGRGAVTLYGKMIDAPLVERARRILGIADMIRKGEK